MRLMRQTRQTFQRRHPNEGKRVSWWGLEFGTPNDSNKLEAITRGSTSGTPSSKSEASFAFGMYYGDKHSMG